MLKRIKRRLLKRNNAGFTLVEVIVASALLGILLLGVIGFSQPVLESVKQKEQNARAVMLCESVESYITQSTKYAYFVQAYSGVVRSDATTIDPSTSLSILASKSYSYNNLNPEEKYKEKYDGASLKDMQYCLKNVLGDTNYEIRCIGMRWLDDTRTGEKKLMLTNEVVDQVTLTLDDTKSKPVFESCYYDGLYPTIEINDFSNQYQGIDQATGNVVDKIPEADVTIAPSLEITMNIYLDSMRYSATNAQMRKSAEPTFIGTSYADYRNIGSILVNNSGSYKVNPCVRVYDEASAYLHKASGESYINDEIGECYFADTYIFYIAKKVKLTSIPTPTPPTPPTP